ncbi:hypothetical protein GCM10027170_35570 [Aliiglaciecola aliphaticivorans]
MRILSTFECSAEPELMLHPVRTIEIKNKDSKRCLFILMAMALESWTKNNRN